MSVQGRISASSLFERALVLEKGRRRPRRLARPQSHRVSPAYLHLEDAQEEKRIKMDPLKKQWHKLIHVELGD